MVIHPMRDNYWFNTVKRPENKVVSFEANICKSTSDIKIQRPTKLGLEI